MSHKIFLSITANRFCFCSILCTFAIQYYLPYCVVTQGQQCINPHTKSMSVNTDRVQVKVLGITYSHMQQGAYVLLLAEVDGTRRIPVVVGTAEAQSIAICIENLDPPRPMTHDLIVSIAERCGVQIEEVYIYRFDKGIFYSTLKMNRGGHIEEIDSRTSDAVAIALRTHSPIYMAASVLEVAGFEASQLERTTTQAAPAHSHNDNYESMTDAELQGRIEHAVAVEAYEEAAMIQQILQKRKL